MRRFLLLIIFNIVFCSVFGQTPDSNKYSIRLQSGYALSSPDGSSLSGLNSGWNTKLSLDSRIGRSENWFVGVGLDYLRTSFSNLPLSNVDADAYSLSWRTGWQTKLISDKVSAWGVVECGVAYMQSRHQYSGNRYRTNKSVPMIGAEIGVDYNFCNTMALSLSYGFTKYGNDNLRHGSFDYSSSKQLNFNPSMLSLGFKISF